MTEQISNFKVADRKSFVEFIQLLRSDLLANPDTWDNRNLDDFLEAMARYADDISISAGCPAGVVYSQAP